MFKGPVPAATADMKREANALYCQKKFSEAEFLYTQILMQQQRDKVVPFDFMKTIWSNRAACYIEMGKYERAILDLSLVLGKEVPTPTGIYPKAYCRLAKCFFELGHFGEARRYIDSYADLMSSAAFQELFVKELHEKITRAFPQRADSKAGRSKIRTRPVMYHIHIFAEGADRAGILKQETVPSYLCSKNIEPIKGQLMKYLTSTIGKYNSEIFNIRPWKCWLCERPATRLTHTPASSLSSIVPTITNYVQPICMEGGNCEREAKKVTSEGLS